MDIAHNAIEKATDTPFLPIILTFTHLGPFTRAFHAAILADINEPCNWELEELRTEDKGFKTKDRRQRAKGSPNLCPPSSVLCPITLCPPSFVLCPTILWSLVQIFLV